MSYVVARDLWDATGAAEFARDVRSRGRGEMHVGAFAGEPARTVESLADVSRWKRRC